MGPARTARGAIAIFFNHFFPLSGQAVRVPSPTRRTLQRQAAGIRLKAS